MLEVAQVWEKRCPGSMRRREDNWDVLSPMFKFSQTVRRVIYTTNAKKLFQSQWKIKRL